MDNCMASEKFTEVAIFLNLYGVLLNSLNRNQKAVDKIITEVYNDEKTYQKIRTAYSNVKGPDNDIVDYAMEFGLVLIENETFMTELETTLPTEQELKKYSPPAGTFERIAFNLGIEYNP